MDERVLQNELDWHRRHVAGVERPEPISADEIAKYRECPDWRFNPKQLVFREMAPLRDKHVLDFGCGQGINSVEMALLGARVVGFDLCPELVEESRLRALVNGVDARCLFVLGEASAVEIEPESYDIVLVDNVMHHIPAQHHGDVVSRIRAALRPGGKAVFREPVQFCRLVGALKRIVPCHECASPDERELRREDLQSILRVFPAHDIHFYAFFARAAKYLRSALLLRMGMKADQALFAHGFFQNLAGEVVIVGHER